MRSLNFLALILGFSLASGEECRQPFPALNFLNERYSGVWYEIGKIQTPGGGEFQKGAHCTIATYAPEHPFLGGGSIGYSSRKDSPGGEFVNATGVLEALETPGHFLQTLDFFGVPGPSVDYFVVWLDDDSAMEYDCSSTLGEYCVHFMSRTPSLSEDKLHLMVELTNALDLNPLNIDYKPTPHDGCWL